MCRKFWRNKGSPVRLPSIFQTIPTFTTTYLQTHSLMHFTQFLLLLLLRSSSLHLSITFSESHTSQPTNQQQIYPNFLLTSFYQLHSIVTYLSPILLQFLTLKHNNISSHSFSNFLSPFLNSRGGTVQLFIFSFDFSTNSSSGASCFFITLISFDI